MIQDVNSAFSCTVMFVSISEVIGCEDRLRNDLYCVEWGVKLYSNQSNQIGIFARSVHVKLLLSCCIRLNDVVPPWAVVASPTLLPSLVLYISRYFWISKEVYETFRNRIVPYCNPGQTGCHRATLCGGRAVWPICLQIYWTCQISIFRQSWVIENPIQTGDATRQNSFVESGRDLGRVNGAWIDTGQCHARNDMHPTDKSSTHETVQSARTSESRLDTDFSTLKTDESFTDEMSLNSSVNVNGCTALFENIEVRLSQSITIVSYLSNWKMSRHHGHTIDDDFNPNTYVWYGFPPY